MTPRLYEERRVTLTVNQKPGTANLEPPAFAGGQGRTAADVERQARCAAGVFVLILISLAMIAAALVVAALKGTP